MNGISAIVDAALLGTASRKVLPDAFPEPLRAQVAEIMEQGHSPEDSLLKAAAMLFAFRNSGAAPRKSENILPECGPETQGFMRDGHASLLLYLRDKGLSQLLDFAMAHFAARRLALPPHFVPYFVQMAYQDGGKYMYQRRMAVWPLLGSRGKWMLKCLGIGQEKFSDSPHNVRLKMFVAMRKASAPGSASLAESVWPSITSRQRADFLSVMLRVLDSDLDFLWKAFKMGGPDGQMAGRLLLSHPRSRPVAKFMEILDKSLQVDGRHHCEFKEIESPAQLEELGISLGGPENGGWPQLVSKLPQGEAIAYKLILSVPLAFWTRKLGCEPGQAARFLQQNPAFRGIFDFRSVIMKFRDSEWAAQYSILSGMIPASFVEFMDPASLELAAAHCDIDPALQASSRMMGAACGFGQWGAEFSRALLRHMIHTRNFVGDSPSAQFLAARIAAPSIAEMESYISSNQGNDTVTTFLGRILGYRKLLRGII